MKFVTSEAICMYIEMKSEDWSDISEAISKSKESDELVQITLNKRDGLYCLTIVCKPEPAVT